MKPSSPGPLRSVSPRVLFISWVWIVLACLGFASHLQAQGSAVLPAGVSLPAKGGFYAVQPDGANSTLVQLHASEIKSNSHAGSNFARSMVYSGPRASVELEGLKAAVHLRADGVALLVRLSDEETDLMRNRLTLVRLRQTSDRRVVSSFSQNIFGGQRKREYDIVPVTKTDVPDANWVVMTPTQSLQPGEYGIIVMPKDPAFFPGEVYDFEVDAQSAKPEKP